ncbi:MAG: (R)-hydratase [Rhodobacteraceae bacterium]|nr:(R)-hydratase [Paracoccaceae bacterium]
MNSSHPLPPGLYGFHDLAIGDRVNTGSAEISADLISRFADVSGDHYAIHLDDTAAQAKGFERRVAHGLLVLSVVDGLKNNAQARLDGLASLGWNWTFAKPVFAGDSIHAVLTIQSKRRTRSGSRGILRISFEVFNQDGAMIQTGHNELIFDL